MTVKVELADAGFDGQVEHLVALQNADRRPAARRDPAPNPRWNSCPAGTLPVSEGKAKRVIDNRTL